MHSVGRRFTLSEQAPFYRGAAGAREIVPAGPAFWQTAALAKAAAGLLAGAAR
jgi:hypothetical protein